MACITSAQVRGRGLKPFIPVIAMVTMNWGNPLNGTTEDIRNETRTFVYSAIASERGPLHFVFVTESWNLHEIPTWFECCDSRVTYDTIALKKSYVLEAMRELRIAGEDHPLKRHGGIGRSAKFFLTDLLPEYSRVMFWDTDVILREPISKVWEQFSQFKDSTLFGASRLDDPFIPERMGTGLCSCLMLLDLEKMRKAGWTRGHPFLVNQFAGKHILKKYAGYGDQALFSVIERNNPNTTLILGHYFMLSRCQHFYKIRRPISLPPMEFKYGTQNWGALHFNCKEMEDWNTNPIYVTDHIRAYVNQMANQELSLCRRMVKWDIVQDS
eukprot:m.44396 g.44396  ORF g.44396 m.44396 type:complete len:327 (-) comp15089_c0_seq3:732-1712(-)